MTVDMLETPAIVVDMEKVRANQKKMASHVKSWGCSLRPHIKTHKIPELALFQLKNGSSGITCAKISEAEVMADAGIEDIFIAYPLVGDFRIRRAVLLAEKIRRLILGADSPEAASALSKAAKAASIALEVRLEVDTGLHRTGVPYERALETALQIAAMPGLKLSGIYTFRGLLHDGRPTKDNAAAGFQEGEMLASLAEIMRANGLPVCDVSGGSTPTGRYVAQVPGVTEVRPGTYLFQDYMQFLEGSCSLDECAAYVLATVVSTPSEEYAVVDGGSKTFGTDFQLNQPPFYYDGFGHVCGSEDLILSRVNEEHGIVTSRCGHTGLKVGQRVKILPMHICSTVNLHNCVWIMENGVFRKVSVQARGMLV